MDNEKKMARLNDELKNRLSEKRYNHVLGVADTAKRLARRYGADEHKAEIAALFHDLYRGADGHEQEELIKKYGLPEDLRDNNNIVHGMIAAEVMHDEYGIDDEDIFNAVFFHTIGRPDMSLLEKIIYVADAIEPNRNYESVDALRVLADNDLDEACKRVYANTMKYVLNQGGTIYKQDKYK